jgi:hypothetical protein
MKDEMEEYGSDGSGDVCAVRSSPRDGVSTGEGDPLARTEEKGGQPWGLAVRALRWLELRGLELDFGRLRKRYATDAWWMVCNEEVTGPHCLSNVLTELLDGGSPIGFVHESLAGEEVPPWETLSYRPLWLNAKAVRAWRVGVWIVAGLIAYALAVSVVPRPVRNLMDWLFGIGAMVWVLAWLSGVLEAPIRAMSQRIGRFWRETRGFHGLILKYIGISTLVIGLPLGALISFQSFHTTPLELLASGRAAWNRFAAAHFAVQPAPAPTVAEVIAEPAPSAPAESAPVLDEPARAAQAATDNPIPAETEKVDIAWLGASRERWPKTVTLKRTVNFPAVISGKVAGRFDAPAGTVANLVLIRDGKVGVEYRGGGALLDPRDTDLLERAQTVRRTSPQAPAATERSEPTRAPARAPASAVAGAPSAGPPGLAFNPALKPGP